jgi:hypothetical protein
VGDAKKDAAVRWAQQQAQHGADQEPDHDDGAPPPPNDHSLHLDEIRGLSVEPGEPDDWGREEAAWAARAAEIEENFAGAPPESDEATFLPSAFPAGSSAAPAPAAQPDDEHHHHDTAAVFPAAVWRPHSLLTRFRDLVGPTTEASQENLFASALAALSFIFGREVEMAWGETVLDLKVFVGILGPAGIARKTTPVKAAAKLIVEPIIAQMPEPRPAAVEQASGSGEGFLEALADREIEDPNADEKGAKMIQTHRRALFIVDELGSLIDKIKRGQAGDMEGFLTKAWDFAPGEVHAHRVKTTKDSKPITATGAYPVICGTSTWAWLQKAMTRPNIENGLVSRFLWFAGDRGAPIPIRPALDPVAVQTFKGFVIWAWQNCTKRQITITPTAQVYYEDQYRDDYYNGAKAGTLAVTAAARTGTYVLKVAMLLAVAEGKTVVDLDLMEIAWAVVRYSNAIVTRLVHGLVPDGIGEMEERITRAMTAAARKHGGMFKKQEIWQRVKGPTGIPATVFATVWDALVKNEAVRTVPGTGREVWWMKTRLSHEAPPPGKALPN